MKASWLKISGFVILVLMLVIMIMVKVFWSAETELKTQRLEPEKLYQMALHHKNADNSLPDMDYRIMVNYCRQILEQYPNSPQAEKAKELLENVPEQSHRQYSSQPKAKKSRSLRRRPPRRRHRSADINIEGSGL